MNWSSMSWGGLSYSAVIMEGDFQDTLKEKMDLLCSVIASWDGSGDLKSMLDTPDQWLDLPACPRRQSAQKAHGRDETRFSAFVKALEKALAEQKQCGLDVLENQSYQRKMPPFSHLGSDRNICKVLVEGFLPSNADTQSDPPHLLKILVKLPTRRLFGMPRNFCAPPGTQSWMTMLHVWTTR